MSSAPEPWMISVVVPTYNDVGRIGDALESIVTQTLPPGEVVVSDDASDDGTEQFVRELAQRHAGRVAIRYVRSDQRSGAWATRNRGVEAARGEWIANCDSDDVWLPTKLERQVNFIREWSGRGRIALLGTQGYNINDAKEIISPADMGLTTEQQYEEHWQAGRVFNIIHSSALFTRSDFFAVGGYTQEYGAADDFPFFCRMADRGVVINIPEPLVYYRKRAGSVITSRFWDLRLGLEHLTENERRRAAGEAPLSREQFEAKLAAEPAWRRFKRVKSIWGLYYYRQGATNMVNGRRVRGAAQMAVAALLDLQRLRAGALRAVRHRLARGNPARRADSA